MKNIAKTAIVGTGAFMVSLFFASIAFSHCEIPCGIYDDKARIALMQEHSRTIEKSMDTIAKLKNEGAENKNQLVRWINNKELHADKIQKIAYQYFMTQRIKPVAKEKSEEYKSYITQLTAMHEVLISAMKCKQTVDTDNVEKLRKAIKKFSHDYFSKK